MAEESKTLAQLRDEMVKSNKARADQGKIGLMTIAELKPLSKGMQDLISSVDTGLAFDKKSAADAKRKGAKDDENRKEDLIKFQKSLEGLGKSIADAMPDFKDLKTPGGIGKILIGVVSLIAGTVVGFLAEISSLFSWMVKPFQKVFGKGSLWEKMLLKIKGYAKIVGGWFQKLFGKTSWLAKVFGKGGKLSLIGKWFKSVGSAFSYLFTAVKPILSIFGKGGKLMKFVGPFLKVFKVAFRVGKIFGTVLGKFFPPLMAIMTLFSGITAAWGKFAEGDILGGIGAFFGGMLDFITFGIIDVEKFTDWFSSAFGNFFGFFEKLFDGDIMGAITDLGNFLLDWFVGLPEMIFDGVLNAIAGVFNFFGLDSIGKWFSDFAEVDILGTIKEFFGKMMEYIGPVIDGIWGAVKSVFGAIYDGFMWIWDNVYVPYIQFVGDLFMKIFSGIGTAFSWIYDNVFIPYISTLGDIMMSVFGGIGDALKWVYNNTVNPVISGIMYFFKMVGWAFGRVTNAGMHVLNGLIDLINSIPNWIKPKSLEGLESFPVADVGDFPSFEMLPGLKSGGMVEGLQDGLGKLFRMGEGGDEMVMPLEKLRENMIDPIITKAMQMMPAMRNMAGGGGGGGNSQVTVVHAPNNSQAVSQSTTFASSMSSTNSEISRKMDMNC